MYKKSFFAVLVLLPVFGGCGDLLKQPYPAKSYFAIETGLSTAVVVRPAVAGYVNAEAGAQATTKPTNTGTMLVRAIRVMAPYDGLPFVYRDGPSQYQTDYYVNWIATPSALLTGSTIEWLDRNGSLPVVSAGSTVRPDVTLDGEVTRLLIDRTDRARPRAVIAARFFLSRQTNAGTTVLSDTSYTDEVPALTDDPAGYATAYGQVFRHILQRLTADLQVAAHRVEPQETP